MAGWERKLCGSLWEHQQNQELIDFQIIHQSGSIGVHKIVLSASSIYFQALLTTCQMLDSSIPLTLPLVVNQDSLTEYLSFLYRGQCSLSSFAIVADILRLADATAINLLSEQAIDHISKFEFHLHCSIFGFHHFVVYRKEWWKESLVFHHQSGNFYGGVLSFFFGKYFFFLENTFF